MPRTPRTRPRDLSEEWPRVKAEDAAAEKARQFVLNVRVAMGTRSLREVANLADINHATLKAVLDGSVWADTATLAKLEIGLGVPLWPAQPRRRTRPAR